MKKIISIFLFLISAGNCFSQQVTFQKLYGGIQIVNSVRQTSDAGYIICGRTGIMGAGSDDVYLLKVDSLGDTLWTRTFGKPDYDDGYYAQQTSDGGYIVAGQTLSPADVYLVKTNATGHVSWKKRYGGFEDDVAQCVKETADGYIIIGVTWSYAVNIQAPDIYLIKTNTSGDTLWTKTYGGIELDVASSGQQTSDGGFIMAGYTHSFGSNGSDFYVVKTDSLGNLLWSKTYGGTGNQFCNSIQQTTDGGYILAGETGNFNYDIYLIKTNSTGDTLWTKTYGGPNAESAWSVQQTTDGGYILGGYTSSFGAGQNDLYMLKTDSNGNLLWTRTFGGASGDNCISIQQTTDGGYILVGGTNSFGSYVYLIKTDSSGNSGCNQGTTATIVGTIASQVTDVATIVSSGATVKTPSIGIGSGGTVMTLCTSVVGINPVPILPGGEGISIVPNPAPNNFTITFPNIINKGIIEIYNVPGKKIFNENIFNVSQKKIQLKNMEAGIYFVKISLPSGEGQGGAYIKMEKLLIEK